MNSLQQLSSISKLLASRNHQNSDVYAHYIHSFRNVSDSTGWTCIVIAPQNTHDSQHQSCFHKNDFGLPLIPGKRDWAPNVL